MNTIKDINDKYRFLHDSIMKNTTNKYAPMKMISNKEAKRNKKPWITSASCKSIKAKNYLLKAFLKNKDQFTIIYINTTGTNWIILFGIVKSSIRATFSTKTDNTKKMWKQRNKIAHKNSSKKNIVGIRNGNKIETDPVTIRNNFNNFLKTVAKQLTENIKSTTPFEKFLDNKQITHMFLMPTDKKEVIKLIGDLSVEKAIDNYSLSTEFVKIISLDIAPSLSDIFNKSFETEIFPDHMKFAMISRIFKSGSN